MAKKNTEKRNSKQYLRTLTKNSGIHHVRNTSRIVKYGSVNFARNIWLSAAATMVMTVTLLVLSVTVFASVVLNRTAEVMRDKIDITIYFSPGTSSEILGQMEQSMKNDSNVKSINISSSEQEYELFLQENASNQSLMDTLKDEDMKKVMLSTMQSTMRLKVYDVENLDSIKFIVENNPLFVAYLDATKSPTYDTNRAQIATVTKWANIARNGGLILGAVFLVISVLVIFNTIRMAIFSRREEIYMMKLVGADKSFIRGPFLVEASMCGLVSGIIAAVLGQVGFNFIAPRLINYGIDIDIVSDIFSSQLVLLYYAATILVGIVIGHISARLAIHKYLNKA